jgi:hypothetical protein
MRIRRRRSSPHELLSLEVEVRDEPFSFLDHVCGGAESHRLLGFALTERERSMLRRGGSVALVVACDRCLWERRLVLRLAE